MVPTPTVTPAPTDSGTTTTVPGEIEGSTLQFDFKKMAPSPDFRVISKMVLLKKSGGPDGESEIKVIQNVVGEPFPASDLNLHFKGRFEEGKFIGPNRRDVVIYPAIDGNNISVVVEQHLGIASRPIRSGESFSYFVWNGGKIYLVTRDGSWIIKKKVPCDARSGRRIETRPTTEPMGDPGSIDDGEPSGSESPSSSRSEIIVEER
jgi:hypothetical protein